jgi:hypothetical protein
MPLPHDLVSHLAMQTPAVGSKLVLPVGQMVLGLTLPR